MNKEQYKIIDKKGKDFIVLTNWISILYDDTSPSLQIKNWKRLIPEEEFKQFEEDEAFLSFEDMLNYIEKYTDYTLFQIIPFENRVTNTYKIKMIYIHK